jgi:hypothetical protein
MPITLPAARPGAILARLRARKEAGVVALVVKSPALIVEAEEIHVRCPRMVSARCRPRNICIIAYPPCTESAAPPYITHTGWLDRWSSARRTCSIDLLAALRRFWPYRTGAKQDL